MRDFIMQLDPEQRPLKYRYENFGGIVASENPPFLAFADRQFMREIVPVESPLWNTDNDSIGLLSAPTEVHLAATSSCPNNCPHCYMDAGQPDPGEMPTEKFKEALDQLASIGVFHIAMGGGEALSRPDIFELAAHARKLGMVPNLTISGTLISEQNMSAMSVFGQVNLSLDALGAGSAIFRGKDMSRDVDRAIDMLIASGVPTGINCVLGKRNYPAIEDIFGYASNKKLNEIEFLRLKPAGRGANIFRDERMTFEQNLGLFPQLQKLSEKSSVRAKIDCSFMPMLCCHKPPRHILEALGAYGCEAGNVLVGARSDGSVSGCSFLPGNGLTIFELADRWHSDFELTRFRGWRKHAPPPCSTCEYLDFCNGGCHAVSAFLTGNPDAPDPDCPIVSEKLLQK